MSDEFSHGDIVWVKCGSLFWPAQVVDFAKLPKEVKEDFPEDADKPKTIAKFFDEDGYEYLFDNKNIFPYNCQRKEEFIKKGLAKSKNKGKEGVTSGWFAKFPNDVIKSEKLIGGDEEILEKEPYVEKGNSRVNYKELFGPGAAQSKKTKQDSPKSNPKKRKAETSPAKKSSQPGGKRKKTSGKETPARPIVHPRFKGDGAASDHQVKILPQPSAPYHIDLQMKQEKLTSTTPSAYTCHICGFAATRLNVIVLHSKSHSEPAKNNASSTPTTRKGAPSTPTTPKERKKAVSSTPSKTPVTKKSSAPTSTPNTPKTSTRRNRGKAETKVAAAKAQETPKTPRRKASTPGVAPDANKAIVETDEAKTTPAKKPRMTKKKKELIKQEKEKKEEERKKIMCEWSEEEEGEAEEKRKINESLGKESDDSDEDSDREAFLGDDHVHGYDDDDEDEEPMETEAMDVKAEAPTGKTNGQVEVSKSEAVKEEVSTERQKESDLEAALTEEKSVSESNEKIEEKPSEEAEPSKEEKVEEEDSKVAAVDTEQDKQQISDQSREETDIENTNIDEKLAPGSSLDIDKLLAETSVPEVSSEIESVVKKSVKFSPQISKDIALKTIRVMQSDSNLTDPQEIEDEFAFTEEPKIPELMSTKTILKRSRAKDGPFSPGKPTVKLTFNAPAEKLTDEDKEEDCESTEDQETPEKPEHESGDSLPEQPTPPGSEQPAEGRNILLQTADGAHIQVHNGGAEVTEGGEAEGEEETYILLVDDDENAGAHLESLNSQTLYIDSTSLANGDLSNVVLMTAPPSSNEAGHTAVTFATTTTAAVSSEADPPHYEDEVQPQ